MRDQDLEPSGTRNRLVRLIHMQEDRVDMARAALLLASEEYPDLDLDSDLNRIDDIALEVSDLRHLSLTAAAKRLSETSTGPVPRTASFCCTNPTNPVSSGFNFNLRTA